MSLGEDNVKLDRELVAHGFSNLASGLVGSVPNYLCYVNTVLCEFHSLYCTHRFVLIIQSTVLEEVPGYLDSC